MIIHSINDLSNIKVVNILKNGLKTVTDQNIISNYHPDFESTPSNLFYILKKGRFKIGNYFVMEDNGEYVGSAGWNEYDDVALLFTRAFIPNIYRRKYSMASHLLPIMFEQTQDYNKLWITFNSYNYGIYRGFCRLHQGKSAGLFEPWPEIYKKFVPIGKKTVNYTEQYVVEYSKQLTK